MAFAEIFKNKLREFGACIIGYSSIKNKASAGFSSLDHAVTVGVRLSGYIVNQINNSPTFTYFHHYRTVNALIDQITLRGCLLLEDEGFNAVAVPASQTVNDCGEEYSGIFPHKTAAVLAGLGFIGKSGLFISNEYGPRIRLGSILTDMPLPVNTGILPPDCGSCRICVDSCPAMALTGNNWHENCERSHIVDPKACSDYMNEKFKHIGRGSVCGICMRVCPK